VVAAGFFVDVPVDVLGGSAAARCRAVVVVGVVALGVAVLGVAVLGVAVLAAVVLRAAGGGATARRTAPAAATMAGRTTGTSEREDHPLRPGGHGQPFEKGGTGTPPDAARAPVSPDRCVAGPLRLEITTSPDHYRRVAAMRGGGRP
jgi:hypothetical protein